jgi:hypothetical protein
MIKLLLTTTFMASLLTAPVLRTRVGDPAFGLRRFAVTDAATSDSAARTWSVSSAAALRDAL